MSSFHSTTKTRGKHRKPTARCRRSRIESLEQRQLLAADFRIDAPNAMLELQRIGDSIQILDLDNNAAILNQIGVNDIDNRLIEINAKSLTVDSDVELDGNSLSVQADLISVIDGGGIYTADLDIGGVWEGDSGNITLVAKSIVIGAGSDLRTRPEFGDAFQAGTIVLSAIDQPQLAESLLDDSVNPLSLETRSSAIQITDADIVGHAVTITSVGASATRWDDLGGLGETIATELTNQLQTIPQLGINSILPLSGQVKSRTAGASLSLTDARIHSETFVTLSSEAIADSTNNTLSIGTSAASTLTAIGFSRSEANAIIELLGASEIIAGGFVDIRSHADSTATQFSRAEANSRLSSSDNVSAAFNIALAWNDLDSKIDLEQTTTIDAGGSVTVDARGRTVNKARAATSVFQDGAGGLSVAVGVDNSDVSADVKGTISSRETADVGQWEFTANDVDATTNEITFRRPRSLPPLKVGQSITYTGPSSHGLLTGVDYIVDRITEVPTGDANVLAQRVRLVGGRTIDLNPSQTMPGSVHTLSRLQSIRFDAGEVSIENDSITLADLPSGVTELTYLGPDLDDDSDATEIGGLQQNQTYQVDRVGNAVALRSLETGQRINLTGTVSGEHGFSYTDVTAAFEPRSATAGASAVDSERDTIELSTGHGLQTGDLVWYETDPTKTVDANLFDADTGEVISTVSLPDAPIDGLENSFGYRVVVDPDSPNRIRLVTTLRAAERAGVVDLVAGGSGGWFVDDDVTSGIQVTASLDATNAADAGISLSDNAQPWPEVLTGVAQGQIDKIISGGYALVNALRGGLGSGAATEGENRAGADGDFRNNFDLAGSIAVPIYFHEVHATIAPSAVLTSWSDLVVSATIIERSTLNSSSEATRRGLDDQEAGEDPSGDGNDTELSLAVGYGHYVNHASAVISDNAQTNAARNTAVTSTIEYPMLVESVLEAINPASTISRLGLAGFGALNDGILGLSNLLNVQAKTLSGSSGDSKVFGGAVVVTKTTNEAIARIGEAARLNQDDIAGFDDESVDSSITVRSDLTGSIIEAGQMAAINVGPQGLLEAATSDSETPQDFITQFINPFGVQGDNAIGGIAIITLADHRVIAEIDDMAVVRADAAINVDATSSLYNLSIVQTGVRTTSFGFSASIAASDIDITTLALIGEAVSIDAGSLQIFATDDLIRTNIVGAFLLGKQIGIGVSVGVNVIDQTVQASIGRTDVNVPATPTLLGDLIVSGAADVKATSGGAVFSLVMAGAVQGVGTKNNETATQTRALGAIALDVPVAINRVTTDVDAFIDRQVVDGGNVSVEATTEGNIRAIVVGASIAIQGRAGNSKVNFAGVGAVAINTIDQHTAALIRESDVTTRGINATSGKGVSVVAIENPTIEADAGGLSLSASLAPTTRAALAATASVAINDVTGVASAVVRDSLLDVLSGDVLINTASTGTIKSLALAGGAGASLGGTNVSGVLGGVGAGARNDVNKTRSAELLNSTVDVGTGSFSVIATDQTEVRADAGGFGISVATGSGGKVGSAIGIALAFNDVTQPLTAKVDASTVTADENIVVQAGYEGDPNDSSHSPAIHAWALAADLGGGVSSGFNATLAGAGSGAHNTVNRTIEALVANGSNLTSQAGDIQILAFDFTTVDAWTVGASLGAGGSSGGSLQGNVGVSLAKNDVTRTIRAVVTDSVLVASGSGQITVQSTDDATIHAVAVAANAGISGAKGLAAALTGGGADATNLVINNQRAEVSNSSMTGANKITVKADSKPKIDASVYGFFVGLVGAAGPTGAAAIGASLANNLIGVDASEVPVTSGVFATVENSSAVATDSIHVEAISSANVDSIVLVVGVAVAGSGAAGLSGSGSGARTRNRINQSIHAKIIGDGGTETDDRIDSPLLSVQASDTSDILSDSDSPIVAVVGSVTLSGSLAIGVSLSDNQLSNDIEASMFNVQNVQNSVTAAAGSLDIDASQTATVNAASLNVISGNAFSAGSAVALSGGGNRADNTIHNRVRASVDSSNVPMSATVDAISNNDIDAIVKSGTVSVSAAQLVGGAAAVGVVTASNTIGGLGTGEDDLTNDSSQLIAEIRNSNLSGGSELRVKADSTDNVNAMINGTTIAATAGVVGAGGVAVDVINANNLLASDIQAGLRNSTIADWNSASPIEVLATDSATVHSDVESIVVTVVGGLNAGGLSVSVASVEDIVANEIDATVSDSTLANLDGTAIDAGLRVKAEENANVTSDAFASAVAANISFGGSINGGGVIAYSEIKSATSATIRFGSVITSEDIEVTSANTATANAKTHGTDVTATLIGIGARGSFATSRIVPSGDVSVSFTRIDARDLTIQSTATPHADAAAGSLTLSTGLAVGVSDATVELAGDINASLHSTAVSPVRVRDLNLVSKLLQPQLSEAYAQGSTGGILIGVDSTVSNTDNQIHVRSTVDDNSVIFASGLAVVEASRTTNQRSRSSSVAGALAAVGVTKAAANDAGQTLARIGAGVSLAGDSLDVTAISHSQNDALTIGANGGVLTVPVAIPATINTVNTQAEIGDGAVVTMDANLNVLAEATATFNTRLQASAGGVLTGGGGDLDNTVTADVVATIGAGAQLTANLIDVRAETIVDKPDLETAGNVHATTGGAVAGLGVDSRTLLDLQTQVTVAANANLQAIHSASQAADINLHAHNTINATDRITMFSGGLASGGGTFSRIETLINEATVSIEAGAVVRSDGEVNISARGGGDITVQSNSDFWGVATLGLGDSIVNIRPRNEVLVRGTVRGDRDVNLSAGTDTEFNHDIYNIESRLDTFAGSIIPVDSISAEAFLIQNNTIDVTAGAEVLSGGDLRLHVERFGDNHVIARMKAVNWVTGLAGAIDNAVAEGGREVFRGTAEIDAFGEVKVDGTVRTGILRNRILEIDSIDFEDNGDDELTIDDYVVTLADNSTLDVPYQIILTRTTSAIEFEIEQAIAAGRPQAEIDLLREELEQASRYSFSSLDLAIAEAEEQLAIFSDNATLRNFYQNEIIRLQGELAKQGLFGTPANVDPTATSINNTRLQRDSIVILVEPLVAQAGSIEIVGDDLTSTGTLDSPGDAKVEIINNTLAFLDIAGISIPENTGGVFLNGFPVTRPDETPTVRIENTATTNVVDGVTYPWPSITVSGDIENLGGDVTLANDPTGDGSITINATLRAATQTIIAGTGTVTINLPGVNTAFQAAGTAHADLRNYVRNEAPIPFPSYEYTGRIEGSTGPGTGTSTNFDAYLNTEPDTPSLIGNQIFISAEYINVNGLIQSGQAEYQIAITEATATEIEDLRAAGESGIVPLQQESNTDFRLSYNFDAQRILVSEVRAGGGYIDLTGRITNTRNGQLQAFGGYASIDIDNQTTYAIQLNRLDVSQRGAGTVIIKDLQRGTAENPAVTIYRYRGDQVEIITPSDDQVISIDDADDLIYQPANGLRYQWIVAQDVTTRTVTTYASKQWLGFVDFISKDPPPVFSQRTFPISQPRLIEGSAAFFVDTADQTRYRYFKEDFTKRGAPVPGRSWEEWTGWFLWSEATYYNEVIRVDGTVTHHRHHMEADRPIDIDFTGSSEGEIRIRSGGDVFIAGHLNNPTGATSIARSSNFIELPSVMQVGELGLIGGREISIITDHFRGGQSDIGEQFGSSQAPLLTDLATEATFDFTSSTLPPLNPATNTQPRDTTILGGQRVLVETDYAGGGTPGVVYQFTGSRTTLDLTAEDYTDATTWVEVDWESHLKVNAEGDVFVREVRGDLLVKEVRVDVANLTAQGSLLTTPEVVVRATELNLIAETGGIGLQTETEERGFQVNADLNSPELFSPSITAQAAGDIFFDGRATLEIQSIFTPGDVRFDMRDAFRVIDGDREASTDERAVAEITQTVWVDLQLTVQHGADDKLDARVKAFEAARTHDYRTYWQFRDQQPDPSVYDPDFRVRLTEEERAFYVDEATITTLENNRTQQYHDLHTSVGSISGAFDPNYGYGADDADRAAIVDSIKVWTEEELTSLSPVTSLLEVSDTEFVIERANIKARNVVINSDAGVGSFQNGTVIEIPTAENPTTLSLYEQALIAAAEPDDFVYLRGAPLFISELLFNQAGLQLSSRGCPSDCPTWPGLGFAPGDTIYIESNNPFTENRTFTILEETFQDSFFRVDGQTADFLYTGSLFISHAITNPDEYDQATHLVIQRREDLDLDISGSVSVTSSRNIFLGSESDLTIGQIDAGTEQNSPRVQIKVGGSIFSDLDEDTVTNIRGEQIVLEASEGAIGSTQSPPRLSINDAGNLIARADDQIVIKQISDSSAITDLAINQIFSRKGFVDLETTGSIVDAFSSTSTNIQAPTIVLRAGGQIGQSNDPLEIETANTGSLTATAGGDIRLSEATGNLNVRQVLSQTGDVELTADFSILDAIDVADPYDPNSADAAIIVGNPRADVIGKHIRLTATLGGIGEAGNELDIDSDHAVDEAGYVTMRSTGNVYVNETLGDLTLSSVLTDGTSFIAAPTGSIYSRLGGDPNSSNVIGKVWLFAADNVGTADTPIRLSTTFVEGQATTGDVYLQTRSELFVGGVIDGLPSGGGEGEIVSSRHGSTQGLSAGRTLSIVSPQTVNVMEGLSSLGDILITARGASVATGRWVQSDGDIVFSLVDNFVAAADSEISADGQLRVELDQDSLTAGSIRFWGSVIATRSTIRGTDLEDTVIVAPTSMTGDLVIETGNGDDIVQTNQGNVQFSGGEGADLLKLIGGNVHLNLLALPDGALESIETIDVRGDGGNSLSLSLQKIANQASATGRMDLLHDDGDEIDYGPGWIIEEPILVDGEMVHVLRQNGTEIRTQNPTPYVNPLNRFDVNRSGTVTASDALAIINRLSRIGSQNSNGLKLPIEPADLEGFFYLDPNNDKRMSALDALNIINALSRISVDGESEEAVGSATLSVEFVLPPTNRVATSTVGFRVNEDVVPTANETIAPAIGASPGTVTPITLNRSTADRSIFDELTCDSRLDDTLTLLANDWVSRC